MFIVRHAVLGYLSTQLCCALFGAHNFVEKEIVEWVDLRRP
jgi:hypothetical protein